MTGKHRFNQELLYSIIHKSNATLVGEYPQLTRDSPIEYICHCGNLRKDRNFRQMEKNGAICWECSKKKAKISQKKHLLRDMMLLIRVKAI